jgi:excisionase family DNA binding protein
MGSDMTLREAAEELGVHYMTAYRYVRLGLLPARKDGSTWRVAIDDLDAFRNEREVGDGDGNGPPARRGRTPWRERFEARLLAGDARGAWGVIEAALGGGAPAEVLYVDVIAGALRSIGDRWAKGEIDVADEHRATAIALRVIGQLGPRFARRGRTRGTILVGTPPGEQHDMPAALLADLLRTAGFEVSDLGSDLPAASFAAAAARAERLVAVVVTVTTTGREDALAEVLGALEAIVPDVPVLVGGSAVEGSGDARSAIARIEELVAGATP